MDNQTKEYLDILKKIGISFSVLEHPPLVSVEDVQKYLNFSMDESLATIILKADNNFIAVTKIGNQKLDFKKIKKLLKVDNLRIASEEEFTQLFNFPFGATPPLNPGLKTLIDLKVLDKTNINGGSRSLEYTLRYKTEDLRKIPNSIVADISETSNLDSVVKKRILTGDTPTGKLHIGHYVGTLENRVKLQDEYETFIILADLHAFTTLSEYPEKIRESVIDVAIDNLAVGLEPDKVHIFVESQIPEIYELASIYSMLVSHSRALRNPTVKDEIITKGQGETFSLGFVNYPMFQAADITSVGAHLVPVGKDQLPHIEQTTEIVDKFNSLYGNVLVRPEALIGKVGKLVGTDGNPKMGKSLGNTIILSATSYEIKKIVMSMFTDPNRIHATDPGKVEGNPVFIYHDIFNPNKEEVEDLKKRYRVGKVGDVEVKTKLFKALDMFLEPIREKRAYYENNRKLVIDILAEGTRITRLEAQNTLEKVKDAMKINLLNEF